jgi:hypothetical protein
VSAQKTAHNLRKAGVIQQKINCIILVTGLLQGFFFFVPTNLSENRLQPIRTKQHLRKQNSRKNESSGYDRLCPVYAM